MVVLVDKTADAPARAACARHGDRPDALIEILHEIQNEQRYISETALRTVADALNISRAEAHGVVTFYHDFRREAPARHDVKICRAEACQSVGSEALAAHAEKSLELSGEGRSADGAFDVAAVYCLGNCALGPAVMIDGDLHGRVTAERFDALVDACAKEGE